MDSTGRSSERTYVPAELVGELFADRYRLVRAVSEGANTAIFDADDIENGRTVTLKLVNPRLAGSPSFRNQFEETIRSAASLSHPNIAALYDWGLAPIGDISTAYVVSEHLAGGSLREMFDRGRRLSASQALAVGLDACRGLDYAHRRGLVHSELTPSKLVFGDDRRLRIVDFGLASLLGETAWQHPESVATHVAWYASPEQGRSQSIDGTTDVYALCLGLHEAVTGVLPFAHESTVASLAARVDKLMPVSADLGPLATVFERAARPDATERSTAAEFGRGLLEAAGKLPRPEPLPLLSTGLFDTPTDELRSPDDPTGGVHRPGGTAAGSVAPAPIVIVTSEPDAVEPTPAVTDPAAETDEGEGGEGGGDVDGAPVDEIPVIDAGDDLVILPLDAGIGDMSSTAEPAEPSETEDATDAVRTDSAVPAPTAAVPATSPDGTGPAVKKRRVPWKILFGVLIAAALVMLGVLAAQLFTTPTYAVPDLIELPEAEARNLVAPYGWEITVERERSDVVPIVGQVVRTAPQSGIELAEGEPFLMVVSLGPTLRELPDSTGVPLGEARHRLEERGLAVEIDESYHEEVAEGTVISWSVPGDPTLGVGALVEPETVVELVVSLGPEPRVVPDVAGSAVGEATTTLDEIGLVLVEGPQEFSDDVALGLIISQAVEPGTEVERGSEITVVVSKGPDLVIFPSLDGVTIYEDAAAMLSEAGFVPVLVFGDAQGEIQSVLIDGEDPRVGETYRRGTQVDFRAL